MSLQIDGRRNTDPSLDRLERQREAELEDRERGPHPDCTGGVPSAASLLPAASLAIPRAVPSPVRNLPKAEARATRPNISVLVGGVWLHGRVTPGEFSKAIGGGEHQRTFKLNKGTLRGAPSVVIVKGARVDAWDWLTPERAKPKRRAAKPRAADNRPVVALADHVPALKTALTDAEREQIAAAERDLDENALAMICIAIGVHSTDGLTQATFPAFQDAVAAHMAGSRA